MFRRSIFLGLMVLLGSVLVYMVLSSRRQEKRIASPPAEIVRQSRATPTRVLTPQDLQIVDSKMQILQAPAGSGFAAEVSALHSVIVRNQGARHYKDFMLKFSYLTSSGNVVEIRSRQIPQDVPPGETARLEDLVIEGLPGKVKSSKVTIIWADLAE